MVTLKMSTIADIDGESVNALVVQQYGKIVLGGTATALAGGAVSEDFALARFRSRPPAVDAPRPLSGGSSTVPWPCDLAVHEALDDPARVDPDAAALVELRFFAGMTAAEAAEALGMSVRSAHDLWAYARSWLRRELGPG